MRPSAAERQCILSHPFFEKIDSDDMRGKHVRPKWVLRDFTSPSEFATLTADPGAPPKPMQGFWME
jgi:hypothetical protein